MWELGDYAVSRLAILGFRGSTRERLVRDWWEGRGVECGERTGKSNGHTEWHKIGRQKPAHPLEIPLEKQCKSLQLHSDRWNHIRQAIEEQGGAVTRYRQRRHISTQMQSMIDGWYDLTDHRQTTVGHWITQLADPASMLPTGSRLMDGTRQSI